MEMDYLKYKLEVLKFTTNTHGTIDAKLYCMLEFIEVLVRYLEEQENTKK